MRRTWLFIVVMLMVWSAKAETSSLLELSAGGGWSTMGYQLQTTNQPLLKTQQAGSYGLTAHVGYGLMFGQYVGLGLGVDLSRYGSVAQLEGTATWLGVSDTEGEKYDHSTEISAWKDMQELYLLEVPVSIYFRVPFGTGRTALSAAIGAKVGLPMMKKAQYSGSLNHTAGYEPWQLNLQNVRVHGFYSSEMSNTYSLSPRTSYAAFAKIGVETALDRDNKVYLFAHAYATYYITNVLSTTDEAKDLGFRNDSQDPAMQEAHQFMTDYTSILDTKLSNGKTKALGVGFEIGIRFRLSHQKKYTCHCVNDQPYL